MRVPTRALPDMITDWINKPTLCRTHNEIIYLLQQFKKTGNKQDINEAIKLCRQAKKMGQRMENRLRLYRDTIENKLGFRRI